MYDWAHPISDGIEGVTHSICAPWSSKTTASSTTGSSTTRGVAERHGFSRPHQYEFARLNLDYTVMSKRKLLALVDEGYVRGWDDPRMPTIAAMRRRGISPEAIRAFADLVGVAKVNSTVDIEKLEFCVRDDLNWTRAAGPGCPRPLKVTITSWPEGTVEAMTAPYFPPDVGKPGERTIPLERQILIERDDFAVDPPPGYQRLAPGRTVRLRYGPCITCDEVVTEDGRSSRSPLPPRPRLGREEPDRASRSRASSTGCRPPDRCRPKSASTTACSWRRDRRTGPTTSSTPTLWRWLAGARLEPSLAGAEPASRWQLERVGYFVFDRGGLPARCAGPQPDRHPPRLVAGQDAAGRAGAGSARRRPEPPLARRRRAASNTGLKLAFGTPC